MLLMKLIWADWAVRAVLKFSAMLLNYNTFKEFHNIFTGKITEGNPVANTRWFTNAWNIHCSVIVKVS